MQAVLASHLAEAAPGRCVSACVTLHHTPSLAALYISRLTCAIAAGDVWQCDQSILPLSAASWSAQPPSHAAAVIGGKALKEQGLSQPLGLLHRILPVHAWVPAAGTCQLAQRRAAAKLAAQASSAHSNRSTAQQALDSPAAAPAKHVLYRGRYMVPFRLLVRFKVFQLVGVAALAVPINTFLVQASWLLLSCAAQCCRFALWCRQPFSFDNDLARPFS